MKFDILTAGLRFNDSMVGEVDKEKHFFSVMAEKEEGLSSNGFYLQTSTETVWNLLSTFDSSTAFV